MSVLEWDTVLSHTHERVTDMLLWCMNLFGKQDERTTVLVVLVRDLISLPESHLIFQLSRSESAEVGKKYRICIKCADAAFRFWCVKMSALSALPKDRDFTCGKINILPCKPKHLADAHASVIHDLKCRIVFPCF